MAKKRIVIVGGGFAGAYCAHGLRRAARKLDLDVVLIDRNNYFIFYPLLVEAGTGSLEPRHAVVPIREFVRGGRFLMGDVHDVDVAGQRLSYRLVGASESDEIEFDHLVLAMGSVTRMPDVPGLREHGMEMKSLGDAVALRDHAIQMLELANAIGDIERQRELLHFVVVGGSFTGVEVAGEFDEFLKRACRHYPSVGPEACSMTLLELGDRLLVPLGPDLSAYAQRSLERRGVDVRLKMSVESVGADHVVLSDGSTLSARTVIWCAGIEPSPLNRAIDVPLDERGYILCDRDLRVQGTKCVWAIGDGAVNPDASGNAYPATAQHALRQGVHLARNLHAVLRGDSTTPCNLQSMGSLAALGCRTGVAKVFGFKLSGFPAWFLWRTVYLMKMPRWSRRVRVALDWTIDLVFSRDFVQLGVHRRS